MKHALAAASVLAVLLMPAAARGQGMISPNVGSRIPALEFRDLAGLTHRVEWTDAERRTYVFFFFEPRCSDCFREFVFFDTLFRLSRGLPLEVFAVEGSGQEPAEVEQTIGGFTRIFQRPPFTVVPDPGYHLSTLFNVQRMPTTLLLESHGMVVARKEGFDNLHAIDLARKAERLLGVAKGRFSPALAALEIDRREEANYERALEEQRRAEDSGSPFDRLLPIGGAARPFEYTDLAGRRGSWRPGRRVTVVFFWGALCQPCIREMTYLEQVRAAAGGALEVIAVEAGGLPRDRVAQVMERYGRSNPIPSFPIVPDPERLICRHFGVGGALPQTFVIGEEGTVLDHSDQFVQGAEAALAGKIERALGLAAGALAARAAAGDVPAPTGEEAPSVLKALAGKEELFRTSLVEAETLYRNWEFGAAIPHYRRCVELDPKHVGVRERLAEIYQRQGDLEKARAEWEEILRLDPTHPEAAAKAIELEKHLGRTRPQP